MYNQAYKVTALELADYVLYKSVQDKRLISNLQLQKILYYIQVKCLQEGFVAFEDKVEAWTHGPVVPIVYDKWKSYGAMTIAWYFFDKITVCPKIKEIADKMLETLRELNVWDLVELSHRGSWKKYEKFASGFSGVEIKKEDIEKDKSYDTFYSEFRNKKD